MRSRIIGISLGLVLAGIVLGIQGRLAGPAKWDLLPESEGRLTSVALQYSPSSDKLMLPVYRAFLREISQDVEVIAVCGSKPDAELFESLTKEWGIERVKTVVVGKPITGWCKDRFLVARSSPNRLICPKISESGMVSRINDSLVAPAIAKAYPKRFEAVHSDLDFDAGDFLQTKKYVIVSDVLWKRNGNPSDFEKKLAGLFKQKVIYLKNAPDHHIGMFVAAIDDETLVVGDPSLVRDKRDWSGDTDVMFDGVAEQLTNAGFKVIRAPLAIYGPRVYITYTNGIFETRNGRHIAYIPTYGKEETDKQGISAFEMAGCEVHPIPVGDLYKYRGTIGCMINVLERE